MNKMDCVLMDAAGMPVADMPLYDEDKSSLERFPDSRLPGSNKNQTHAG